MIAPVRIGIDARKLHDFGIGTYIRNLLRQLARLDRESEFILISRPEDRATLASLGPNFRPVAETAGNYSVDRAAEDSARAEARARHALSRAALRPAAARQQPVGRDDPRLHPPDVPAIPAGAAGAPLCPDLDQPRVAARDAGADRVGKLEARHPEVRRHPGEQDRRDLQRLRRTVRGRAARGRRRPRARALPAARRVRAVCRQRQAAQEPRAPDRGVPAGARIEAWTT